LWIEAGCRSERREESAAQSHASHSIFVDATREAGLAYWGHGKCVALGDFDGDGWLDLHLSIVYAPNRMFRNNGDGTFADVTTATGVAGSGDAHGAAFADINNDGSMDLFVANCAESVSVSRGTTAQRNHLWWDEAEVAFADMAAKTSVDGGEGNRSCGVAIGDIDGDGLVDIFVARGGYEESTSVLYRNRSRGDSIRFEETAKEAGVAVIGHGYACAMADVNSDGALDLFVGNLMPRKGETRTRYLFLNDGHGRFTDATERSGIAIGGNTTACAFGDFDNDGRLDLCISTMPDATGKGGGIELYRNRWDGTFEDVTERAGLASLRGASSRGVVFGDVNNDGHLDLYVANCGGTTDLNRLFINRGDGTFRDATSESGLDVRFGHGCAFGDMDNDGDLDLFVSNWLMADKPGSGQFRFFRNATNNGRWLKVRVKGKRSNASGIGAKVSLYDAGHCGDHKFLRGFREVAGGSGVFSCPPLEQHFGLPRAAEYDLEVVFPTTGKVVRKPGVPARTIMEIREPGD
jgi:hypothetical protein